MKGVAVVAAVVAATLIAACGTDGRIVASSDETSMGTLRVLVAASLLPITDVLAANFTAEHPGLEVQISGAGSSTLREQILAGAPADVFIPADAVHLDPVRSQIGLVTEAVTVARNPLVLAVPSDNPAEVSSLADLARPGLLIGLCAPEVPCGALARSALAAVGIEPAPDTEEPNVRALVTKLAAGELDAGVVYASDASSPNAGIASLGWSAGEPPRAAYAAAVIADAPNRPAAALFVEFLVSEAGQMIFAEHGFESP